MINKQRWLWCFIITVYVTGFIRFSVLVLLPADGTELLKHGDRTVIVYTLCMCWELYNKKHIILHRMYINTFHSSGPSFQSHVTVWKGITLITYNIVISCVVCSLNKVLLCWRTSGFLPVQPLLIKHVFGTWTSKTSINCNVFSNAEKEDIINTVDATHNSPCQTITHKLCISVSAYNLKRYLVCKWTDALEEGLTMKYTKTFCQEQPLHLPTGFVKNQV